MAKKRIASAIIEDMPWLAEPDENGFYRVVNSKSVILAQKCVKEEAELFAVAPALLQQLAEMVAMAGSVSGNWENGDLVTAVNNLERIANEAKIVLKRAHGNVA